MAQVIGERLTAQIEQPIILFLIGGQGNKPLHLRKNVFVVSAFLKTIHWLRTHPESGFLHGHLSVKLLPPGIMMTSYWRSYDDLERFARGDAYHLKVWDQFTRMIGLDKSVGVWHEAYEIMPTTCYEVLYCNMPITGLVAATKPIRAEGRLDTSRGRFHKNVQGEAQPSHSQPGYSHNS